MWLQNFTEQWENLSVYRFLRIEISEGKRLKITDGIGVDVSVTPHKAILEDIPPTEMDVLKAELIAAQEAIDFLIMGGAQNA